MSIIGKGKVSLSALNCRLISVLLIKKNPLIGLGTKKILLRFDKGAQM